MIHNICWLHERTHVHSSLIFSSSYFICFHNNSTVLFFYFTTLRLLRFILFLFLFFYSFICDLHIELSYIFTSKLIKIQYNGKKIFIIKRAYLLKCKQKNQMKNKITIYLLSSIWNCKCMSTHFNTLLRS